MDAWHGTGKPYLRSDNNKPISPRHIYPFQTVTKTLAGVGTIFVDGATDCCMFSRHLLGRNNGSNFVTYYIVQPKRAISGKRSVRVLQMSR